MNSRYDEDSAYSGAWYDALITTEFVEYFSEDNPVYFVEDAKGQQYSKTFLKFCDAVSVLGVAGYLKEAPENMERMAREGIYKYKVLKSYFSAGKRVNYNEVWQSIEENVYECDISKMSVDQLAVALMHPFASRMGSSFEDEFALSGRLREFVLALYEKEKAQRKVAYKHPIKVYMTDTDEDIVSALKKYFEASCNVEVFNLSLEEFLNSYEVECIVSPGNSFGLMDGGYDAAITDYFGEEVQYIVQKRIAEEYYGEQPIGTSLIVSIPDTDMALIHTPSMRVPERIYDPQIIYNCMRSCLMLAYERGIKSILIPAFGGGAGQVEAEEIAKMMWYAWKQIHNRDIDISWENALNTHYREL